MTLHLATIKPSKAWRVSGLLILLGAGVVTTPVLAQSDRDMQTRINRLENEIDTLSRAIYRGEQPPPGAFSGGGNASVGADVEIRLQQMEVEIRDLRGEVERVGYETQQLRQDMERITGDLELRMNDLQGGGSQRPFDDRGANNRVYNTPDVAPNRPVINTIDNAPPQPGQNQGGNDGYQWSTNNTQGQLGSYTVDGAGNTAKPTGPAALYDYAFSLVKQRQYAQAQKEFDGFLKQYPSHELAGNAKYWLGETYYVQGDFSSAARVFAEGYQQYPKGSKAADNLLKLGLSLDASGKPEDACIALRQLKKENPAGATPVLRRADQEMTRLGC